MSKLQVLYLFGAGLSAAVGQIGITLAYSFAAAKIFLSLLMLLLYLQQYSASYYLAKHQIYYQQSDMLSLLVQVTICLKSTTRV